MIRKYFLPLIALMGAICGLLVVFWSQKKLPVPPILFPPAVSPYPYAIAGSGIIESSSENIAIGSPFNEIVGTVFVVEGDIVKAGDPLFQLDLRNFEAQKASAAASLESALVTRDDKKTQLSFYERLKDARAVSEQEYSTARYALLSAEASMKVAMANLQEAEINIDRSIIRAPLDGRILQVNLHKGELAPISPIIATQSPSMISSQGTLIVMGRVEPLQIRIDIDEDDAWRFQSGSEATAFVRGNSAINFPLKYVRTEPYIIPKTSFTGQTIERVDTRVLQVLYNFDKKDLPIYVGQVLDIYIKAEPLNK